MHAPGEISHILILNLNRLNIHCLCIINLILLIFESIDLFMGNQLHKTLELRESTSSLKDLIFKPVREQYFLIIILNSPKHHLLGDSKYLHFRIIALLRPCPYHRMSSDHRNRIEKFNYSSLSWTEHYTNLLRTNTRTKYVQMVITVNPVNIYK